jgi:hypothetical protein
MRLIDSRPVSDSQWVGWCTDDERGQEPKIRITNIEAFPFCVTTPSGEPIKAYRTFKLATMARLRLIQESES